ncbi:sensor histidine kinase [Sulfuricystis multivorans]|uniref:sensor histidine kinase n=1 Tax=Sulfuricystis multivorans TaxID=2211108 RepID=UPI000F84D7C5|nr:ATP-binding protein [Sulfuricystis multivorans]
MAETARFEELGLGRTDFETLAALNERACAARSAFEALFSGHLAEHPEIAALLERRGVASEDFVRRHAEALFGLLAPRLDGDYARERLAIGEAHHRVGLDPFWFLGAYRLAFETLWSPMVELCEGDLERFGQMAGALVKAILLDLGYLVEAYFRADHARLQLLARVFESDLEAVLIVDASGKIVEANHMVAAIGYRSRDLVGQPLSRLWAAHAEPHFDAVWRQAEKGGVWHGELWLVKADGGELRARLSIAAVGEGEERHYVVEFSDITEEWQAARALAEKTAALETSNRELEQFAYVASHDLQEPLRMVASYTQLLARRYRGRLDADADEFIAFAVDGAQRMQTLINDLLKYSRVGTRGKPFAAVSGEKALDAALANPDVAIRESAAVIERAPLPTLWGDEMQLVQLFQNLIGNAIKFKKPDTAPHIRIEAQRTAKAWEIAVADDGIGIAPEYFERIFLIFQRLHPKEQYPGSGIGLAIAKKIVERHGGMIRVESAPGRGARFVFSIADRREDGHEHD